MYMCVAGASAFRVAAYWPCAGCPTGRLLERALRSLDHRGVVERLSAMPQPRRLARIKPPIGQRRCPSCGLPLLLSRIEASEDLDYDERIFECSLCAYAETTTVRFR